MPRTRATTIACRPAQRDPWREARQECGTPLSEDDPAAPGAPRARPHDLAREVVRHDIAPAFRAGISGGRVSVGISAEGRGKLSVNEHFQTTVPHIYAAGDVVGFPALASTSMEQGRLAACHAFGIPTQSTPQLFPYGIYTIPEISTVGRNEEELTEQGIPYEVGKAQYREIARGQIIGDQTGLLKLIFHLDTHDLLGVHIIGEGASELVHIGQAVMAFKGRVEYFINNVFNYPTLAECYKTAAFDGINRLGA
jgi:NAD(P) transhydrogenase